MIIKRKQATEILQALELLGKKRFNISTQYKMIKIKKALLEEQEIYQEQIKVNCEPFFELDDKGCAIINEQGGYKIKQDKIIDCRLFMEKMNSLEVQVPDIYFSLDELEDLDLSLDELSLLEPFIK